MATPDKCDPRLFASYHLQYAPPFKSEFVDWPNGHWAVYAISGDEIASRVVRNGGKVVARHPWPGYLGGAGSLEGAMQIIAEHQAGKLAA